MRPSLPALSLLLALAAVTGVRAQSPAERRLDPAAARAVEAIADSARALGLPAEALHAKAAEGLLKGAPDARIVTAVRTLAHELRESRRALGPAATPSELVAGATAIHAGVPAERVRQLAAVAADRGSGGMALPIVVLVDLVTRRVPTEVAAGSVQSLLERRAPDASFEQLRAGVEQDVTAGRSPAEAAVARARALVGRVGGRLETGRP